MSTNVFNLNSRLAQANALTEQTIAMRQTLSVRAVGSADMSGVFASHSEKFGFCEVSRRRARQAAMRDMSATLHAVEKVETAQRLGQNRCRVERPPPLPAAVPPDQGAKSMRAAIPSMNCVRLVALAAWRLLRLASS